MKIIGLLGGEILIIVQCDYEDFCKYILGLKNN